LAGDNQYRCDQCARLVDAKRGLRLSQLPPILTLSLSRFTYSLEGREKITKAFPFPLKMVSRHGKFAAHASAAEDGAPPEVEYELFSVIVVSTAAASCRHHYHNLHIRHHRNHNLATHQHLPCTRAKTNSYNIYFFCLSAQQASAASEYSRHSRVLFS
jgi:ubiquitin C-terminal hydrolase